MALEGVSIALPLSLFASVIRLIGLLLLGSGAIKAIRLMIGRHSSAECQRGWPMIACQLALDILLDALVSGMPRGDASSRGLHGSCNREDHLETASLGTPSPARQFSGKP
jgi:hypothetical protein